MKATLLLVVFVAFSASAQNKTAKVTPKRCGGSSGKTCAKEEVCVGEKKFKDGLGVCVSDAFSNQCANALGSRCPNSTDYCVEDPRNADCPPGVMDCGNGLCVQKNVVDQIGVK
ncbi:hypothetical protein KRR26_36235 [Corallococcus sp. M34]|uniref:hypothetical protein n=1 Tax=Citreicoccus inhibens TaxID=2849499 RepID=UPI001C2404AC|nr:hypothetical protein [Citreicoccus inhibens]MBU8901048.1 hypothetical protein [Citreicoccus inhibens]